MSHTPGPWVVNRGDYAHITNPFYKGIVALISHDETGPFFVCNPDDRPTSENEWEANARLIAAAPDLLAAIRSVEWTGEQHDRDNCWPACPSCGAPAASVNYSDGGEGDPGQHMNGCVLAAAIAKAEGK